MSLAGRRFLVTGASSGIGRATAILLSQLGAQVACTDVDEGGLFETQKVLAGDGHCAVAFDLHELSEIGSWLSSLVQSFGTLHGFVHAAGIPAPWPIRSLNIEAWRRVFVVNTEAALVLTQNLQGRKIYAGENGSIVFISSIMGQVGSPAAAVYSMSKGALDGMARSLALELAARKIRVNCVAPAFVRTPMFERMESLWDEQQRAQLEALHPLGIGRPEDVANAVAFLLADTARWITGTVLVVDGGYSAQ
jgi:NAD(P)-dependent dehydrogenase (short-subunit alcohol dehydrogenase family)